MANLEVSSPGKRKGREAAITDKGRDMKKQERSDISRKFRMLTKIHEREDHKGPTYNAKKFGLYVGLSPKQSFITKS